MVISVDDQAGALDLWELLRRSSKQRVVMRVHKGHSLDLVVPDVAQQLPIPACTASQAGWPRLTVVHHRASALSHKTADRARVRTLAFA